MPRTKTWPFDANYDSVTMKHDFILESKLPAASMRGAKSYLPLLGDRFMSKLVASLPVVEGLVSSVILTIPSFFWSRFAISYANI